MRTKRVLYSAIVAAILCSIGFGVSAGLTLLFPEVCWTPRVGGSLVGMAVFLQGYMFANPDKFSRILSNGITLQKWFMPIVYMVTIFGTFLWAFGDLLPFVFGVPNCISLPLS